MRVDNEYELAYMAGLTKQDADASAQAGAQGGAGLQAANTGSAALLLEYVLNITP